MTVISDEVEENPWDDTEHNHCGGTGIADSEGRVSYCFCQKLGQHQFLRRLEASASVQFDWPTFWKELLYHTFFPLSLPLIILLEGGRNGVINRQFWGSRLAAPQWILSIGFILLNSLTFLYISPDIVITDILWIMRNMILATKYGFINKGEMEEMRAQVLPQQVHSDRTLVMAWTYPIPVRVLKRELLLAALRKDQLRCTSVMRLVPGASRKIVNDIMQQLPLKVEKEESRSNSLQKGSGWGKYLDQEYGFNQNYHTCAQCKRSGGKNDKFEDKWVDICISQINREPGRLLPNDSILTDSEDSDHNLEFELGEEMQERPCPTLDLPALLIAAYVIQRACDLLTKRNFLHQIYGSPRRVFILSAIVAVGHCIMPFAARAIIGKPSVFGGSNWYHIVLALSVFSINFSAMSASVMFMVAGSADFRRRYFISRLLNTMLKDGWYGQEKDGVSKGEMRRLQKHMMKKSIYHLGFTIDFTDAQSLAGWWAVRSKVHDFGLVFYLRVKQYASYFALYCALLMSFLIVELFANGARTTIYLLAVVVYDLLVFVALLCLMVFPGGATNDMNHEHGATLVRKKLVISNQLHCTASVPVSNPMDRKSRLFVLELLHSISAAVYWDNSTMKVTILGFTAGGEFIAVLLGVGSAAIGIAAQQVTNRIH